MTTVVASVLFTDLLDSTGLAQRLGPAAAEALRQTHFGLLRGAVQAAGGVEVKNLGDGLLVVFSSPSRALACAVGMQQAIARHNRRGASNWLYELGSALARQPMRTMTSSANRSSRPLAFAD